MRADARRNQERLLAAARAAFSTRGTDASLEDIARRAGVGIGTLYRRFPTREALIEAVVHDDQRRLCDLGRRLLDADAPLDALAEWLAALVAHAAAFRGLAASLSSGRCDGSSALGTSCREVQATGAALVARAQRAGLIRADARADDVLDLAVAVAWVSGQSGAAEDDRAARLLDFALHGLRPQSRNES